MKDLIGLRVFVYYNSRKKCWSVKDVCTNKVVASVDCITLRSPKYKVSEKGRERVLKEGKKNVHAGIEGIVSPLGDEPFRVQRVTYSPQKNKTFVASSTRAPIRDSHYALFQFPYVYALWRYV